MDGDEWGEKKNKKKFENNLVYQNIIITFEYC
jgi:hypothetical protein